MSISFDKYSVTQYSVSSLLGFIEAGAIAVPEIQRPFVWRATQVRDLIDSLYNGYPTGYLIIWQNPDVKLKDGGSAVGKKVLIDGQQRVTAMMTAIAGQKILTEDYEEKVIRIAFNPLAKDNEERFAVGDLFRSAGDVHHIFPKEYLKKSGITDKSAYNQVVNYAYLDTGVNISISDKSPSDYFSIALHQCETKEMKIGTITNEEEFWANLSENCIPAEIIHMTATDYQQFLQELRAMMAMKIKEYYYSL